MTTTKSQHAGHFFVLITLFFTNVFHARELTSIGSRSHQTSMLHRINVVDDMFVRACIFIF